MQISFEFFNYRKTFQMFENPFAYCILHHLMRLGKFMVLYRCLKYVATMRDCFLCERIYLYACASPRLCRRLVCMSKIWPDDVIYMYSLLYINER
jgi:hypothetical protein